MSRNKKRRKPMTRQLQRLQVVPQVVPQEVSISDTELGPETEKSKRNCGQAKSVYEVLEKHLGKDGGYFEVDRLWALLDHYDIRVKNLANVLYSMAYSSVQSSRYPRIGHAFRGCYDWKVLPGGKSYEGFAMWSRLRPEPEAAATAEPEPEAAATAEPVMVHPLKRTDEEAIIIILETFIEHTFLGGDRYWQRRLVDNADAAKPCIVCEHVFQVGEARLYTTRLSTFNKASISIAVCDLGDGGCQGAQYIRDMAWLRK